MRRMTIIAAAVAGAGLPLVAYADSANVQIYGKLYPQFGQVRTTGATAAGSPVSTLSASPSGGNIQSHSEVNASNSRLGFRGKEDLGGGFQAFFQIEQRVSVDTGALAPRNTFVGLSSGFGTVKLGIMDTVYKEVGDTLSFLGVSSGNFVSNSGVLSKVGFGTSSASSFHLRRANSLVYQSPVFGGIQILAQYSPDEAKTAARNADLQSYGITYKAGGLYLALAHEIHNDTFGGSRSSPSALSNFTAAPSATSKDRATRATAQYRFGNTRVEANYATLAYKESGGLAGRFEKYEHDTYSINLQHRFGKVTGQVSYAHAGAGSCSLVGGAACGTSGLDGGQLNVGAAYDLSKRTSLFALYSRLANDSSARYSNLENGKPEPGADISQWALGISHSF